mmetsp:Transcript_13439/g.33745  ORF Transcript_13439/g.33745 Transcript_13439/m.33745 type:complete len:165 (-) Transcript_13439:162-656(-)|eukprot:CAMPEP_0198246540 /NCGR_PEP_ID=MMETSP1446-20131203/46026_1 /TAXON_ID=1461542 ORGANISM="Unidentified sp, Strain CCMP2111" /NCGR_SAMPLE_ID=MMETSP1446 /ASSEMBLY_ACC=CAM_ASM_001112 /LENGTH=164 /DNA_ID=CAMNT_0043930861 /DNA_START=554 /DNA_END=1048 /DNA_ORIENTATION=-
MADEHPQEFESAESGASLTYPQAAGACRKNGFIVIKGRPCKILDVSTSKTGKHGHAKCHFTAQDVFTGKKMEMLESSTHNCEVPNINRMEYTLMDVTDDGFLCLIDDNGDMKEDLKLPSGTDNLDQVARDIQSGFDDGKELIINVLGAMGEEMVVAQREATQNK